ncbi:hypothetical protein Pelo_4726 [Pelomyxa schiedti]|nr:hypothetical protein Pelo_4726 [Pelomyxa schiedti]
MATDDRYYIVVLGSQGVGKSSITIRFVNHLWVDRYDPSLLDTFETTALVDGRKRTMQIVDTAPCECFVAMSDGDPLDPYIGTLFTFRVYLWPTSVTSWIAK